MNIARMGGYTVQSYSASTGVTSTVSTDVVKRPGNTDQTRSRQHSYNVLGQLIATFDALGTSSQIQNSFYYDSHGNLSHSYVGANLIATMTYDLAGNRLTLNDVNTGNYTFQYNGRGLMTQSTDALGQVTQYSYDVLGRLRYRYDRYGLGTQVTNEWNWDAPAATGQLEYVTNGQFQENYSYQATDAKLSSVSTSIAVSGVLTKSYSRSFTYDPAGRLATIAYPNLTVTHEYSSLGYLTKYKNGSTVLDEVTDTDAFGNVTEQRFNNAAMRTSRSYESTMGRLTSIQTGTTASPMSVQDLQYVWQSDNFPLLRQDRRNTSTTTDDYRDVYNYDDLGRLYRQQTDLSVSRMQVTSYDVLGNLVSKTSNGPGDLNVTGYTYATAGKPHRLTSVTIGGVGQTLSYNSNGSITQYDSASGNDTFFTYDGQNNVQAVTVGTSSSTPTPKAKDEFWYTPDGERFLGRETWDASGVQRVAITTYLGAFEEIKPSAESGYNLFRRVQVTPTVMFKWRSVSSGATVSDWRYQYRDHLGSMDAMTDGTGALVSSVVGKTSFDPFGARRSKDWSRDITPAELQALLFVDYEDEQSPRGFTDHEQLNRTGFIHMNGRVYDPRLGRFVSADPIVQAPTFSQSYNRYAYVMNNPVSAMDPSGFATEVITITAKREKKGGAGGIPATPTDSIQCDEITDPRFCIAGIEIITITAERLRPLELDVGEQQFLAGLGGGAGTPAFGGNGAVGGTGGDGQEEPQSQQPTQCFKPSEPRSSGQNVADAIVGFGDAFLIPIVVRDLFGINGAIDYGGPAYTGGMITGTLWGSASIALRGGAALGGTRVGHGLNHNPTVRLGPGRMPAAGGLPSGTGVPRISFGSRPGGLHGDLRSRVPHLPPVGALAEAGDGC